uniref:Uncharacterized protein n=1 Tax=Streptomyces lavendulae TaxID=1914 RepID=B0CN44_STRLA|nr:hypothetical protein [Streptomyces lavendulae]
MDSRRAVPRSACRFGRASTEPRHVLNTRVQAQAHVPQRMPVHAPPRSIATSALISATRSGRTRTASRTSRLPHAEENFTPGPAAVRCSATCWAASARSGTVRSMVRRRLWWSWRPRTRSWGR